VQVSGLLGDCAVLREMFDGGMSVSPSGAPEAVHSNLTIDTAEILYNVVLENRPSIVIEIGMAFGVASLAILSALEKIGGCGQLISIDPNQSTDWKQCGVAAVERAGLKDRHTLIEDFDYFALPRLLGSGQRVDFAFIDGWHTFDYTLLDFWYLDRMLDAGGIVAFDDCGFPAVDKAIRFITSHRKYDEIDVGLPAAKESYAGLRGAVKRMVGLRVLNEFRRLTGRQTGIYTPYNRYFRKVERWEPTWQFFTEF
jgi:predicted O-methyltransferase YrrM